METENGRIEGDVDVVGELYLNGMVAGSAAVLNGATLHLNGMVTGNLTIQPGATAFVHGTVIGNAINNGGNLKIYGSVGGVVRELSGNTYIDPNAVVKNGIVA